MHQEEKRKKVVRAAEKEVEIRGPQSLWVIFLLNIFTFSLYSSFWFVGRTREFNILHEKKYVPWLWFFIPMFALAHFFALPAFVKSLNNLAKNNHQKVWGSWYWVWIVCCFVTVAFASISDRIGIPLWVSIFPWFAWAILMTVAQSNVNRVKNSLKNVTFKGSYYKLTILEWLLLIPGMILTSLILYFFAVKPLMVTRLLDLDANSTYVNKQLGFELPVKGEGWSIIEKGTLTDDDKSVLELEGPLNSIYMYIIVYKYKGETINSISEFRKSQMTEDASIKCEEERGFASKLRVKSRIECKQKGFRGVKDWEFVAISIFESDNEVFELFGYLSAEESIYLKHLSNLREMAKGFEPL